MFKGEFFHTSAASAAGFYDYQIEQSARFDTDSTSSNASRLTRTFSTVDSNVHFYFKFLDKKSYVRRKFTYWFY